MRAEWLQLASQLTRQVPKIPSITTSYSFLQVFGIRDLEQIKNSFSPSIFSRHSVPTKDSDGKTSYFSGCFAAMMVFENTHARVCASTPTPSPHETNQKGTDLSCLHLRRDHTATRIFKVSKEKQ